MKTVVVIGGTTGIGHEVARRYAGQDARVHITGRDQTAVHLRAREIGGDVHGIAVDLATPETIADALAPIEQVDHLVIAALERDHNTIASYDIERAKRTAILKLVGYTEVIHTLRERFSPGASIVLFGGLAAMRPWPGSVTVSSANGGVAGLTRALAVELGPIRVNAVHPGVIGDSPHVVKNWTSDAKKAVVDRTPLGRMVGMAEVVDCVVFLLENGGVSGVNLDVDGGWLLR